MAEGFLRHFGSKDYEAFSAGVSPVVINPFAIKVMREVGIDISKQRSKSVEEFSGQSLDDVITVCDQALQKCPVFPGRHQKRHWDLQDPAKAQGSEEERLKVFRAIRDQIMSLVQELTAAK